MGQNRIWLSIVVLLLLPLCTSVAYAHRSGCHRWHSCPSDRGTYICGDLGYCSQCPDNQYCAGGHPRRYYAPAHQHSADPSQNPQSPSKGWRADVLEAQRLLNQLGYNGGELDGILGPQTVTALKQFQADRGMTPSGILDVAVLTALRAAYEIAR